jgi:transcriptional regulator with XRE-family HTH domain
LDATGIILQYCWDRKLIPVLKRAHIQTIFLMNSQQLITALKRELKNRDLTYATLAQRIDMSEASIKRMLASGKLGLDQLDAMLTATGIDWADLVQSGSASEPLLERLPFNQETALVANPKLFAVAVCTMNNVPADTLLNEFSLSEAELVQALGKLDRMGFLSLLPNNRYSLKLSRTFNWIPNGPIQVFFRNQAVDYLSRDFTRPGESFQVVNVLLSQASAQKIAHRLRDVAQEINALHLADARLPYSEKGAQTLLLALRPWMPPSLRELRQNPLRAAA